MPGFAQDIRPLFRDRDRRAMQFAFDLGDYADVRAHADAIYAQVASGDMPCDGAWPPERVALFREWMDGGYQP
jgi:hypothetical protein